MMKLNINDVESKAMTRNLFPIFMMGASGLIFGYLAGSSAIILDGAFSTVILLTVLLAKKINKLANAPRSYSYPRGRFLLENIYILFKIIVLMTILVLSIGDSILTLYEYFYNNVHPGEINQFYANLYYLFKLLFFGIAICIYYYYYKQTNKKSSILKLEMKAVLIDGTITITIFLGFLFLGQIPFFEHITDSIILFLISCFLLYEVSHDFKEQLNKTLGKRDLINKEIYYRSLFNVYFADFEFLDIYIFYLGKACTVSIIANFEGTKGVADLVYLEHEIKRIMGQDLGQIYLYMYWDGRHIGYDKKEAISKI